MNRPLRRSRGVEQVAAAPTRESRAGRVLTFDALYRSCRDDVHAYVAGLLRDRHAAEDVTALAFERAYRRRRRFDPRRGSGRAWVFAIARNAALDELRRRQRTAALEADPEDVAAAAPDEGAELALRRTAIRAAIGELDLRDRELITLRFFAGLGHAEIAMVLGISTSNAGTRLHRAVDKLRRACDETA
jgi:RNA polymerase sigma-70 factor (ECF subfamily)